MVDDLGGRLVQAGLVTRDLIAQVLGSAPPHEGALVASLADRGLSEDALVGFFVAEGYGPMMGRKDLDDAEPSALEKVPAGMAVELLVVPIYLSPAGLVVAMVAPTDTHALAELERASGGRVLPAVARVGDVRAAQSGLYPSQRPSQRPPPRESQPPVLELVKRKVKAPGYQGSTKGAERVSALATVGPRLSPEESDPFVPLVRTKPVPKKPPVEDEGSEPGFKKVITRNFERLKKQQQEVPVVSVGEGTARAVWAKPEAQKQAAKWTPGRPMVPPKAKLPVKKPPLPKRSQPKKSPPPPPPPPSASRKKIPPKKATLPPPAAPPPSREAKLEVVAPTLEVVAPTLEVVAPTLDEAPATIPPPSGEAPLGLLPEETIKDRMRSIIPESHDTWDLEAPENQIDASKLERLRDAPREPKMPEVGPALARIRAAEGRDEVLDAVCEAATGVSRAAILLTLRKQVLKGWSGAGHGVSRDAVRNLWIPTSTPSMFREVVSNKTPYVGPPGTTAADGLFRAAVGGRGGDVALHPVTVGGKLVGVLAVDDLGFGEAGARRVEELARAGSEALERIVLARKKRG